MAVVNALASAAEPTSSPPSPPSPSPSPPPGLSVSSSRAAPAWRGLVLVLSPQGEEDDLTRNAMVRISGELGAALFQVVSRPVDPAVDIMLQVETAGSDLAPIAAFAIARDPAEGQGGIAVWVSNRLTRITTVQHVRLRSGGVDRAATQLAVETVELVRANIVGLRLNANGSEGGTAKPDGAASSGGGPAAMGVGLAVGVGLFQDFGTTPSSWAPTVALSFGRPEGTQLRLTAVGLGPGSEVAVGDGTGARMQRELLAIGLVRRFRSDRRVQFLLSAAGGVHQLRAQGTGAPAERERSASAFSALLLAGGGGTLALGPHLALTAEAEALLLWPTTVVRVGQSDAARLHLPALFAHGGLLATF